MKINQVLVEAAGVTVAFAFGRFNPAHQGHVEVWRAVENAGANWFIGTNPNTLGPNDPLTFEQKSAWMEEIYPPIQGHIVPEQSVLTLAAYIFKKLRKNERATVAYITDATDWAWSGKLLNQYNGVEGSHGYYKFAQIIHEPSPRVSSATALRDAARADDRVAFYHASGTDPNAKVNGLTYFDTVKQAVEKYPLPVKKAKKVAESSSGMFSKVMGHETSPEAAQQILQQGFKKSRTGIFFNVEGQNYSGGGYGGTVVMAKVSGPIDDILNLEDDNDLPDDLDDFADGEEIADYARSAGYWAWTDGVQFAVLDPRHIQVVKQGVSESLNKFNHNPDDNWSQDFERRMMQDMPAKQKTVAKTWGQMTSQEKLSGIKGRTVWNEKTRKYYTVFDVPAKQETDEASLATMRDYFAGDKDARDPYEITKQRLHFSKEKDTGPATHRKEFRSQWEYEQWLKQNKLKQISGVKEDEEAGEVKRTGQLIPFPAGTTKVSVSDVYDWYKLGQVISDLDDADPAAFGQGAPETVIAFGSEEEEHKLLPLLQRLGLKLKDIDQPVSEAVSASSIYEMLNKRKHRGY